MSLKINKILNSYDEYRKIDSKDEQKQNEWLGRHWMHVDGNVSKSNGFQKFLAKFFLTSWIFKKINSIDIKKTHKNLYKAKNDYAIQSLINGINLANAAAAGNVGIDKIKSDIQESLDEMEKLLKTTYIFLSFKAYIKKNSDPSIKDKIQSFEKAIADFPQVKQDLAKDIFNANASRRLGEITKEFVALKL